MQPTPQRFLVQGEEKAQIAPTNAGRYGALLSFAEAIPLERAVQLYSRLYPLFQQAYEELGYPGRYFNDRFVAVLDHLLQTPEPQGPLAVRLLEVRGEVADPRPGCAGSSPIRSCNRCRPARRCWCAWARPTPSGPRPC